jgi:DNA-binding transcriptional ArsR family regulator
MENIQKMEKYEKIADKLKALAHPHRICIVNGLMEGSCNVSKVQDCMGLPQSTISQHLSKLKAAGIITGKRSGTEILYQVVDEEIINIMKLLTKDI